MENISLVLIPVTIGLTEAIKRMEFIPSKFMSIIAVAIGIALGLSQGLGVVDGIIIGLAASGLYTGAKNTGGEVIKMMK